MTTFLNTTYSNFQLESKIQNRISQIEYTWDQKKYLEALTFELKLNSSEITAPFLDKLRTACQLWDVDLRNQQITSHRKIIGPIIVSLKKLIAPIIKFFLKDFIRQQKDFNAAILALMIESKNSKKN